MAMNDRIRILKDEIPLESGTQIYEGFCALRNCDGQVYREFRNLAGGPRGTTNRSFSPSTVRRRAIETGYAEFVPVEHPTSQITGRSVRPQRARNPSRREQALTADSFDDECLNLATNLLVSPGVTLNRSGIYIWRVRGVGSYVGKYTHMSRPLSDYNRNVVRLLRGQAYRPNNPDGFRRIHRALAGAVGDKSAIALEIVENCDSDQLNEREAHYIGTESSGGLNG
jgi:hypothetical protein